jgi:hypothetical protein
VLRNDPRLVQLAQFVNLFKSILKLKTGRADSSPEHDNLSPADLEHAILKPQFNPLVGELVTKLLSKNLAKITTTQNNDESENHLNLEQDSASTLQYETWNVQLAKKMAAMFKQYRKFAAKHQEEKPTEQ